MIKSLQLRYDEQDVKLKGVAEPFHRLEEFPTFVSCITCFGRPIIPPLLTPSLRCELQDIRASAVNKETNILNRKKDFNLKKKHVPDVSSSNHTYSDIQTSIEKSCALWYPSSKDCHEGVSIAISKLPTGGIYSSVHMGAIVCSNVIENSHRYASNISRDSIFNKASSLEYVECSHSNINSDCHLCRVEYDQSFHNCSFGTEISPEVPCRTYSLLQQSMSHIDDEQNSTVEETECESLPTVICSQKYGSNDTDSESNVTSMTQSTDLEKYMEVSCEFGSPDNSTLVWDSKSSSQQYSLSRSDDASSETVVNTENELTPCASTLAEFTDNIEDELSLADDSVNKDVPLRTLRRSHSVDSYMKIIQNCARNMHVKKSSSEPLNTNSKLSLNSSESFKVSSGSKIGHLIKEDSKESEESKEIPEKDINTKESKEISLYESEGEVPALNMGKDISHQKRHIRQNSYTLDYPSSVLIQAHGDCSCSYDVNCISPPHCSALKDNLDVMSNSAFMKEKVEVDIPFSVKENYHILSSNTQMEEVKKDGVMLPLVDIFPVVQEIDPEKNNAENLTVTEDTIKPESISLKSNCNLMNEFEQCRKNLFGNFNVSNSLANQEYFKHIFQELQESHEMRMRKLREEQNSQWLKLQEELKEQERLLYEKVKHSIESSGAESKAENKNIYEADSGHIEVASDSKLNCIEDDSIKHSSVQEKLFHKSENSSGISHQTVSHISSSIHSQNLRAFITPSNEKTPYNCTFLVQENIGDTLNIQDQKASTDNLFECNKNPYLGSTNPPNHNINGFPSESAVLLPQCNSQNLKNSVVSSDVNFTSPSFCERFSKQCDCCISYNGYSEHDSHFNFTSCNPRLNPSPVLSLIEDLPNKDFNTLQLNSSVNFSSLNKIGAVPESLVKVQVNCCDNSDFLNKTEFDNDSGVSKNTMSDVVPFETKKDSGFTKNSKSVSLLDIPQLPINNNLSQPSLKVTNKLPGDNIISLCLKSMKSGSVPIPDAIIHKQIIIDPAILKKFEKLPAFVKGYLTRRLFKTERVVSLIRTLQDTALLIEKLSEDLSMKGDEVSERDVNFHRQLICQLMKTFNNVYHIFCGITTKDKMSIIAESRDFRLKQKLSEQRQESLVPATSKAAVSSPIKKHKSAVVSDKALKKKDKKRSTFHSASNSVEDLRTRSAVDNRTYTIEDLRDHIGRSRAQALSKSHSSSPASVHKVNVGNCPKRKTTICKTSNSRRVPDHRWVP